MKKKILGLSLTISMVIPLVACGNPAPPESTVSSVSGADTVSASTEASDNTDFTEKKVPVFRDSMNSNETVNIRIYDDKPDVPYMKIDDYYNQIYFTGAEAYPEEASKMAVSRRNSDYTTTAYNGVKAVFDAEADSFNCENLDTYTATPYYSILLAKEADPSAPFVRAKSTDYKGDVKTLSVDLCKYGIDIIGDGDELWVPLSTLQYTFCTPYSYIAYYNGKGLYLEDSMSVLQTTNARAVDSDYFDFTKEERSPQKIDNDYGNLCYYLDNFYGYPAQSRLSDSIRDDGLDKTLDKTIDEMDLSAVKKYLKSGSMTDYACGLFFLFNFALDDGGHTAFTEYDWVPEEITKEWISAIKDLGIGYTEMTKRSFSSADNLTNVYQNLNPDDYDHIEQITYSGDNGAATYMEKGDTAMFVVSDHYYCDRAGWAAYYKDSTIKDLPLDSLGAFVKALDKAKSNPDIKKFVVNISMCSGGESGFSSYISKIMCGQSYRHQFNEFSGQDETLNYDIDMNFDRVFDEKDDEVSYPFTFAVVAGAQSYSAANYLANMAKDNGVALLGETTGGGANSPQHTAESEGFFFNLSSRYKLMDKNNEHVDFGVEPDFILTKEKDGKTDYSDFFNIDVISQKMEEFAR